MSMYISHMNSMQSTILPQAMVYMNFTSLTYDPEQIFLPNCKCVSHCANNEVCIWTPDYCIYN